MTTAPDRGARAPAPPGQPSGAAPGVSRITRTALEQRVRRLLPRRSSAGAGAARPPVILVRAEPVWEGDPRLRVDGTTVRVVACVSTLAVLEQVTAHAAGAAGRLPAPPGEVGPGAGDAEALVLLTDRDEGGILSRVLRHRVHHVEPWALVEESFGAASVDAQLSMEKWAVSALLDAMPPGGWPRLTGPVLTRDHALRSLAARRLGLDRLGLTPADLDVTALLRWSALPGAVATFTAVRPDERAGLVRWFVETIGTPAEVLFAAVDAGFGVEALSVGLMLGVLWAASPGDTTAPNSPAGSESGDGDHASGGPTVDAAALERARGRAESYLGVRRLPDEALRRFADAAHAVVVGMLAERGNAAPGGSVADAADPVPLLLRRAEFMLRDLGMTAAGARSDLLPAGLESRLGTFACTVHSALDSLDGVAPPIAAGVDRAAGALGAHHLAAEAPLRVEQAAMAVRLLRWLARPPAATGDDQDLVADEIRTGGWVDTAAGYIWAGDVSHPDLQAAYRRLYQAVAARRRDGEAAFAVRLADATAGALPVSTLGVESVLERIVAPLLTGDRGVLLVVLDGMSAAVAVQLAEDLRRDHWDEYDPLGDDSPAAPARRRAAVAALPTITAVSRASLLAGALTEGRADGERAAFEHDPRWRGRSVRLFHRGALGGGAGAALHEEVVAAISGEDALVAVVINTVDDSLDAGREGRDPGWRIDDVAPLAAVLHHARAAGRAVVLTSDHGHVPEHGTALRPTSASLSARHRIPTGEVAAGEVELAGRRVLAPGGRIVALWDSTLRYNPRRAGYHGGAAPAEVTIPMLAFLPFIPTLDDGPPKGWRPLADQRPGWWTATVAETVSPQLMVGAVTRDPRPAESGPSRAASVRPVRRRAAEVTGQTSLDLPVDPPTPAGTVPSPAPDAAADLPALSGRQRVVAGLVAEILASEMFTAQLGRTPRRMPTERVAAALTALLEAGGTLATAVVAERAGEHPARATGFATVLQRVFNVDNYPVLALIDSGRTLRLEQTLLREQFGLRG